MFELMPFGCNDLYRPFRDLENLERSFFSGKELGGFKTDIKDTGNAYVLEADLPGVKKEDIHIVPGAPRGVRRGRTGPGGF